MIVTKHDPHDMQALAQPRISGRNLIVLSDGTGNRGGLTRDTNVWRLYKTIDRHHAPVEQLVRYDDGVGTDDFRLAKMLGGAFGLGLTRNVTGLYGFLASHYRPGDRIYLLGFSRGAFTVRVLGGIIARCGLWTQKAYFAEDNPERFIRKHILPAYRSLGDKKVQALRDNVDLHPEVYVRFLGVWDTVDAVGVPVDELKVLLEVPPRLLANRRGYGFHDRELSRWVHTARQALSIDDDRRTFHPNVWSTHKPRGERDRLCQDVKQVWFAGAHSNVGGSYPKDGLAFVTLDWMLGESDALGRDRIWLKGDTVTPVTADTADKPAMAVFDDDNGQHFAVQSPTRITIQQKADAQGRHYEPRSGPAMMFRYRPRLLEQTYTGEAHGWARWLKQLPEMSNALHQRLEIPRLTPPPSKIPIHVSVPQRLLHGTQDYAPYVLPEDVEISHTRGPSPFAATSASTPPTLPEADAARNSAKGAVWMRLWAYWITLIGILVLPFEWWLNSTAYALVLIATGLLLSIWAKGRLRWRAQAAWRKVLLQARLLP